MNNQLLDLGFDTNVSFIPSKIDRTLTKQLFTNVPDAVKNYARTLVNDEWRFFVVNQTRGRCYYQSKVITIPAWLFISNKGDKYKTWYISHEMAHAFDKCLHSHGDEFMAWLKRICPKDCIHFELSYKPQAAIRNGIGIDLGLD